MSKRTKYVEPPSDSLCQNIWAEAKRISRSAFQPGARDMNSYLKLLLNTPPSIYTSFFSPFFWSADLLPPYAVASLSQFDAEARGCQTFMPGQVTWAEGAWKRIQARRGSVLVSNIWKQTSVPVLPAHHTI